MTEATFIRQLSTKTVRIMIENVSTRPIIDEFLPGWGECGHKDANSSLETENLETILKHVDSLQS